MSEWAELLLTTVGYSLRLPLEIALSPICLVSSRLYDGSLALFQRQTTPFLPYILKIEALLTMGFLVSAIRQRLKRSMFYAEFVLLTALGAYQLTGIIYSLLQRVDYLQEFVSKLAMTLLIVCKTNFISEAMFVHPKGDCGICWMSLTSCYIELPCRHSFHEDCMWRWVYERRCCPHCTKPL